MPMNESLLDWILQLPNVSKASHRFGGTEFQVHGLEFMHTHGTSHLHQTLQRRPGKNVRGAGRIPLQASPHF
jgi:hypothetical protein